MLELFGPDSQFGTILPTYCRCVYYDQPLQLLQWVSLADMLASAILKYII